MKAIRLFRMASLLALALPLRPAFGAIDIYNNETFAGPPANEGWVVHGDASLFSWNNTAQALDVTWNSSRPNSYFHRPLGITLSRTNDFIFGFDLKLSEAQSGADPNKPGVFQLSVGLINLADATASGFARGSGFSSPNLVEFTYFPGEGPWSTVAATMVSSSNDWGSGGFTFPLALQTGAVYHVELRFVSAEQRLLTRLLKDGQPLPGVQEAWLRPAPDFGDFQVDTLAVCSYSDEGQDPLWAGSVFARGSIDNLFFMSPPPVAKATVLPANRGSVRVDTLLGWEYSLERTEDWLGWDAVPGAQVGTGGLVQLADPAPPAGRAFYRVRARKVP